MVAFSPGAVLTAANLNTAFNALTLRTVTGTSDTLLLDDNGGGVTYSNAAATTSTIPPNSSVAFAVGTKIVLINLGAGVVTVTAGAGVTVNGSVLTLAQDAGGTCIKTATNTWYFLPSASAGAGMDLITPTSVAGSGVTLSGGQVTFTAATAVSVNGCFSATYDNYRIVFEGVGSTVDVPKLRLRLAGTDASGANYDFEQVTGSTTTVSAQNYASETSWSYFTAQSTVSMIGEVIIRRPNLAQTTMVSGQGGRENAVVMVTGYHTLTTQYDGFSLLAPSGNLTGTLRVYGMRNS
jgi:hypothetical protein